MEITSKANGTRSGRNTPDANNEYPMSENPKYGKNYLNKNEYSPIGSTRKLTLLLQRSLRYSYRQRCCGVCPTILFELLFPVIILAILALARYGSNELIRELNEDPASVPKILEHKRCPQNLDTPPTLSKDLFKKCFEFPPSFDPPDWKMTDIFNLNPVERITNIIFQPETHETQKLVDLAKERLKVLKCDKIPIW